MAEDKPSFGMQMAQSAASAGANTLLGQVGDWLFGKKRDKRQLEQQKKLNDLALQTNKDMLTFSNEQSEAMQNRMWEKTNLSGQLDLMRKEGMSISAMYGGSGASGSTTGSGGGSGSGVGAGQADGGVARGMMSLQFANQLAMQRAQVENLKANTEKTRAEAQTQQVELETTKQTQEATIDRAIMESLKAKEEWTKAIAESQELNRGLENRLAIISAEATGKALQNEATKMGIKVSEAQISKMAEEVAQGWQKLSQEQKQIEINKFKAEIEANYPGLGKIAGKVVDNVLERTYEMIKGRKHQKTYELK